MNEDWWLPSPASLLSQGDVVTGVPIGTASTPLRYLKKAAIKSAPQGGWQEELLPQLDHNGVGAFLTKGKVASVVILNHSCDIDKERRTQRIIVAPLVPLSTLSPEEQVKVTNQRKHHALPLPEVPSVGEGYVDLRCITFLPKEIIDAGKRVASMTDQGVLRLQAQLVAFFTRVDASRLLK